MKLAAADYLLCRLAHGFPGMLKRLGDLESEQLGAKIEALRVDRPVFITGLARSGTTILLNAFSALPDVATHRYRDFPFLFTPYWWHWYCERAGRTDAEAERPHRDRIKINRESPDAFEEPLWQHFFPFVHDAGASHVLTRADDNAAFDAFFTDHLRKILLLRGKSRYVSKGNYNLTRLDYLCHLFPDARFVIPIRHPVTHVESLVRQHELFSTYSDEDARVPEYLRAAGHYEFGPQRVPINVDEEASRCVADAWRRGDDRLGYAVTWRSVYDHVRRVAGGNAPLAGRVRFMRYEDLCAEPARSLAELFAFCGFDAPVGPLLDALPVIAAPQRDALAAPSQSADAIWQATCSTAEWFGYTRDRAAQEGQWGISSAS